MDKYILQLGDLTCTLFDKVGLDKWRVEFCYAEDTKYQLGWFAILFLIGFVAVPSGFSGVRTAFVGHNRRAPDEKEN